MVTLLNLRGLGDSARAFLLPTMILLGVILGLMLLGLAVLAARWHIAPRSGQTALSQMMAVAVGRSWAYYPVTITITMALAANTSFASLPLLASVLARTTACRMSSRCAMTGRCSPPVSWRWQ